MNLPPVSPVATPPQDGKTVLYGDDAAAAAAGNQGDPQAGHSPANETGQSGQQGGTAATGGTEAAGGGAQDAAADAGGTAGMGGQPGTAGGTGTAANTGIGGSGTGGTGTAATPNGSTNGFVNALGPSNQALWSQTPESPAANPATYQGGPTNVGTPANNAARYDGTAYTYQASAAGRNDGYTPSSYPTGSGNAANTSTSAGGMPGNAVSAVPGVVSSAASVVNSASSAVARPGLQNLPASVPTSVSTPAALPSAGAARTPLDAVAPQGTRPNALSSATSPAQAQGNVVPQPNAAAAASSAQAQAARADAAAVVRAPSQNTLVQGQVQAGAPAATLQPGTAAAAQALGRPGMGPAAAALAAAGAQAPGTVPGTGVSAGSATAPAGRATAGGALGVAQDGGLAGKAGAAGLGAAAGGIAGSVGADGVARARVIAAAAGMVASLSATSTAAAETARAGAAGQGDPADQPPQVPGQAPNGPRRAGAASPRRPPPPGRTGGRLERVEAVSRFMQRRGEYDEEPEEDEDEALAEDDFGAAASPMPDDGPSDEAERAANLYRQLASWLRVGGQDSAVRELTQQRRVLLMVPRDEAGHAWDAHLMCPAQTEGGAAHAPGTLGLAWPLRADGAWAPQAVGAGAHGAPGGWQRWRMRQQLRADGVWQLDQSDVDSRAPAWCVDGPAELLPVPDDDAIPLRLTEPRRLRRLLGAQWTLLVLRAPVPLARQGGPAVAGGAPW